MPSLDKLLSQTKVKIMMSPKTSFISSVLMALDTHFDESVPTACTQGSYIKIGPEFFRELPVNQRLFLLLHEAWHVVFEHPFAMQNCDDPKRMNQAQDFYINQMLVDEGFEFIPNGCLDSKYKGWTVLEIYRDLENKSDGDGGGIGQDVQLPTGSKDEVRDAQARVQEIIVKAAMQAEMAGQDIPEDIKRVIDAIRNPKLPWTVLLENYMTERVRDEYSWSRRNKRYQGIYLPSLAGEGMGEIRCYVDASGSISQKELALEVAEMIYIKEITNPSRMTINAFSHYLGKEQAFERDEEIEFDVDASGGTSLAPVWRDIRDNPETEVVVIFTDGHVEVPPVEKIDCSVIFVIVNNPTWSHPDFLSIHMEIKHD